MPATRTPNTSFRFQGRKGLLTYSRIGDAFTAYAFALAVVEHIRPLGNEYYQYRWAVEKHHDEGIPDDENASHHVHVAFDLGKPCTERGHVFDFGGHHPNLKPCGGKKQWENQVRYLEKDGWYGGNIGETAEEDGDTNPADDVFRQALAAETYEEYSQTIADGAPEDFCKSYISIRACGQDRFRKEPKKWESKYTDTDFTNIPPILEAYKGFINSDEEQDRPKTLIIISPTRYGKTQWARNITPDHAYMCTEWNPDRIPDDARLLIFDDVPMSELLPRQRWKAFFGMQQEFEITGKYRGSRSILRSWKGFIYLSNIDPRDEEGVSQATKDYITQNSYIVTLDNKLYN